MQSDQASRDSAAKVARLQELFVDSGPRLQSKVFWPPQGDIVLVASDGFKKPKVGHLVDSSRLRACSSVFKDMLDVADKNAKEQDLWSGKPLVNLTEDVRTVETILHCVHGSTRVDNFPDLFALSLDAIIKVSAAALKYNIVLPIVLAETHLRYV